MPGDPRPLRRRNQILALMARNGYIPEDLAKRCQAEPVRRGRPAAPVKTQAPAAIEHVFDELKRHGGGALRGRGPVPGADLGPLHGGRAGADHRERGPGERPRPLREAAPEAKGLIQGSVVVLRNADAGDPGRGGRAAGLPGSLHPLLRLQPRHRLAAPARLGMQAARLPGRVPPGPRPRHHGARRAHRGADGRRPPA